MKYSSQWEPNGPYGIVKDTDVEGGFRVVADDTERNNIPRLRQKVGMQVYVTSTAKQWRLTSTADPPLSNANFTEVATSLPEQTGSAFGVGCIGVNACVLTFPAANTISIAAGVFYDFLGRKITNASAFTLDTSGVGNGVFVVTWDQTLGSGAGGWAVKNAGSLNWRAHLAFGVFRKVGGLITDLKECQLYADGSSCQTQFSIGEDASVAADFGRGGNFNTLKKALIFRCCYSNGDASDPFNAPRKFAVYDQINEGADLIDFKSWEFTTDGTVTLAEDHLEGLHIYGAVTATTVNRGILRWGVSGAPSTEPYINFGNLVNSVQFSDLRIEYYGTTGTTNDNCWLKDPGSNLVVTNCGFGLAAVTSPTPPAQPLDTVVNYATTQALGGNADSSLTPGTVFNNCTFASFSKGQEAFSLNRANMTGVLTFNDCSFGGSDPVERIVGISSAGSSVDVHFKGGRIGNFNSCIIESLATSGAYTVGSARISAAPGAQLGPSVGRLVVSDCTLTSAVSLGGVRHISGSRRQGGITITDDAGTSHAGNDLGLAASFQSRNGIVVEGDASVTGELTASRYNLGSSSTRDAVIPLSIISGPVQPTSTSKPYIGVLATDGITEDNSRIGVAGSVSLPSGTFRQMCRIGLTPFPKGTVLNSITLWGISLPYPGDPLALDIAILVTLQRMNTASGGGFNYLDVTGAIDLAGSPTDSSPSGDGDTWLSGQAVAKIYTPSSPVALSSSDRYAIKLEWRGVNGGGSTGFGFDALSVNVSYARADF